MKKRYEYVDYGGGNKLIALVTNAQSTVAVMQCEYDTYITYVIR